MQTNSDIPASLAEVDAEFLTGALRHAKVLDTAEVVSFEKQIIGEGAGFLGEVVRLTLQYSEDLVDLPPSVILKIPTTLKNRNLGQMLGVYEREIRFYTSLQPKLAIRTPRVYYAALDIADNPEQALKRLRFVNKCPLWVMKLLYLCVNWLGSLRRRKYVLLMEDLGELRTGDQVAGCSPEDARTVLDAMAAVHAGFWNSVELENYPWVIPMEDSARLTQVVYLQALPHFIAAHENSLTADHLRLLEWLRLHGIELIETLSAPPYTLLHGDFRLDNLCFDDARTEIVLFDWQTLLRGPPGMELAYFLSASMHVEVPRQLIMGLVDHYGNRLRESGVTLSPARLRWEYQAGMLLLLHRVMPAQFQNVLDLGEDRGQELMSTWAERVLAKLEGVNADRLMASRPD